MPCANCGKDLKPGARFCTACGTVAAASQPAPRPATQPTAQTASRPTATAPQAGVPTPPPSAADEDNIWAKYQPPIDETVIPGAPPKTAIDIKNISPRIKAAIAIAAIAIVATAAFFIRKANQPPAQPLSGVYSDPDYNLSLTFPAAGWNLMLPDPENPEENTRLFQRGDLSNPDAAMKVYYTDLHSTAPLVIPDLILQMQQQRFITSAEIIIADEGYVYTHKTFSLINIGESRGIFLEGDGKRGDETPRVMFFNAMHGRRSFYILFILHGKDKEALRAEALKIIDSLKFL